MRNKNYNPLFITLWLFDFISPGVLSLLPLTVLHEYKPPLFQRGLLHVYLKAVDLHVMVCHLHSSNSLKRVQEAEVSWIVWLWLLCVCLWIEFCVVVYLILLCIFVCSVNYAMYLIYCWSFFASCLFCYIYINAHCSLSPLTYTAHRPSPPSSALCCSKTRESFWWGTSTRCRPTIGGEERDWLCVANLLSICMSIVNGRWWLVDGACVFNFKLSHF